MHHATIFELNVESYRRRAALEEKKRGRGRPASRATTKTSGSLSQSDTDPHFTIEIGDRNVNIDVIRAINLDEERMWRQMGHEGEYVGLRNIARYGGETFDQRGYSMRRNRPEDTPVISRTPMERPGPPQAGEDVPAVRVHPDGRRVTYMGRLKQREPDPSSEYQEHEELSIAIHCGPV